MKNRIVDFIILIICAMLCAISCDEEKSATAPEVMTGTLTDIDGNTYNTIKIGNQWWMAENLRVRHFQDGAEISHITDNSEWKECGSSYFGGRAACCAFSNEENNVATYGLLYNWYAMGGEIAPDGWRVPTDEDWKILEQQLGMSSSQADEKGCRASGVGGQMKDRGTSHWASPNEGASNTSGFAALPGGLRYSEGSFSESGHYAYFWTSNFDLVLWGDIPCWHRYLRYDESTVCRSTTYVKSGLSIRLVKE